MVENNTTSEAVHQYYTIVNDSVVDNTKNQNAFLSNSTEDKNKITYLYVEPISSDVILNSVIMDDEHNINVGEMRNNGMDSQLTNIEFILDDGQINTQNNICFDEVDDNYTIDLEYVGIGHSAEEELEVATNDHENVTNISLCKDVLPESSKRSENFIKVQLVDGTCAYINQTLWNSLLNNIKQENVPKVPFLKQDKKISCTYSGCDKVYTSSHHLAVHVRNHTGCRPYQCPFLCCEKSFATGYSLKAHLRTHTGEAPYGCKICPKHFKTSGDLQKHIRTHTGEKPFKCPIEGCGRSFTTSNIRKVHVRSHTGERPYACTYPDCKKAFASATNFKNHMRIHSGEKPYKCSVPDCGKCFTEYSSLFKHNAVHKPYIPITCEICNQDFKHESTLRSHKQAIHKIYFTGSADVQIKRGLDGYYPNMADDTYSRKNLKALSYQPLRINI